MLQRSILSLAAAVIPLLAACAPAVPAAVAAPAAQPAAGAAGDAEVRGVIDQWVSAYNRDDAAAVAGAYAPDGAHIVGTRVEGRAAIQQAIAGNVPRSTDFAVSERRFGVVGVHAWEAGIAQQTITPESGQPYRLTADYVALLARQPDGAWKIQTLIAGNQRQQPLR